MERSDDLREGVVDCSWVVVGSHVLIPGVGSLDWVMEDGHQLRFREKTQGSGITMNNALMKNGLSLSLSAKIIVCRHQYNSLVRRCMLHEALFTNIYMYITL